MTQSTEHTGRPPIWLNDIKLPPGGRFSISYWPKDAADAADIVRGIPAEWRPDKFGAMEVLRCTFDDVNITVYIPTPEVPPDRTAPHATAILEEAQT